MAETLDPDPNNVNGPNTSGDANPPTDQTVLMYALAAAASAAPTEQQRTEALKQLTELHDRLVANDPTHGI